MKHIMVTGATGFIGRHLVRKLVSQSDCQVSVLVRNIRKLRECLPDVLEQLAIYEIEDKVNDKTEDEIEKAIKNSNENKIQIKNLTEFLKQQQIECVIHLATNYITQSTIDDIEGLIAGNITFGVQILEAMKLAGVKNFIYTASSWQHYQNQAYCPVNVYAATKQAFEDILRYYTHAEGICAMILEVYDTYGEEDDRNKILNHWKQAAKTRKNQIAESGEVIRLSLGEQKLDFIYIEDIVTGILKAMQLLEGLTTENGCEKKYALSSENVYTLREIAALFEQVYQTRLPIKWGGKPYRDREVMEPYRGLERLPEWEAIYGLREGLKNMFQKEHKESLMP